MKQDLTSFDFLCHEKEKKNLTKAKPSQAKQLQEMWLAFPYAWIVPMQSILSQRARADSSPLPCCVYARQTMASTEKCCVSTSVSMVVLSCIFIQKNQIHDLRLCMRAADGNDDDHIHSLAAHQPQQRTTQPIVLHSYNDYCCCF